MSMDNKTPQLQTEQFTIAGERMRFVPLPLCTLLLIRKLEERIGEPFMKTNPIVGALIAARCEAKTMMCIAALYTLEGVTATDDITRRCAFLNRHCDYEDIATICLCGMAVNARWMSQYGARHIDTKHISEKEFYEVPFVLLLNDKSLCQE